MLLTYLQSFQVIIGAWGYLVSTLQYHDNVLKAGFSYVRKILKDCMYLSSALVSKTLQEPAKPYVYVATNLGKNPSPRRQSTYLFILIVLTVPTNKCFHLLATVLGNFDSSSITPSEAIGLLSVTSSHESRGQ